MITLVLDSSGAASAAILDDEAVVASWAEPRARKHAEHLAPALRDLLAAAPTPDQVVVGVGPAPFTGLRAGIAMGLGVSLGLNVPAYGWCSHDGLALRAYERLERLAPGGAETGTDAVVTTGQNARTTLLVATDARRKEVYWTSYSGLDEAGVPVVAVGPDVSKPVDLAQRLAAEAVAGTAPTSSVLRVGRGFDLYAEVLGLPTFADEMDLEPVAADIGRAALRAQAAGRELLPVTPLYLREPDAKPLAS